MRKLLLLVPFAIGCGRPAPANDAHDATPREVVAIEPTTTPVPAEAAETEADEAQASEAQASEAPAEAEGASCEQEGECPEEKAMITMRDGFDGGLGLRGVGEGGGGYAEGIGSITGKGGGTGLGGVPSKDGKTPPAVRPGEHTASGKLDREIIRRTVRRHLSQVRHCYEKALIKDPALAGEIRVSFVIGAEGTVTKAEKASSTVSDDALETCVVDVFARMRFPKPEAGVVQVTYPLVFASDPGDGAP